MPPSSPPEPSPPPAPSLPSRERELTEPVELCDQRGRLNPHAKGWSRRPLHRANLRRAVGRKKRWDYWCVLADDVIVSITYADIDYAGLASFWILDPATGVEYEAAMLSPLGRGVSLPDVPCTGTVHARRANVEVEIAEADTHTRLTAFGQAKPKSILGATPGAPLPASIRLTIDKPSNHDSLNVVIPWSDTRFQFTSKQNTRRATGTVTLGPRTIQLGDAAPAFAVQDLGRGVWPYRNRWNWGAGSGYAADGALVGLQFGGMWTVGTGFTENALCVDGQLTKIGEELEWTYDWDRPLEPWRVRTPGSHHVDVTLTPTHDRYSKTDLRVVSMEVHQCFGTWSGTVVAGDGRRLTFDGLAGFAEEARNRW